MNTMLLPKTMQRIQIAPGATAEDIPREEVPRYGFVKLMRQADGSYLPILQSHGHTVRLGETFCQDYGIDTHTKTIRRLIVAGFVSGHFISPHALLVDLSSFHEHMEACKDPDFWTPDRRKKFSQAIG